MNKTIFLAGLIFGSVGASAEDVSGLCYERAAKYVEDYSQAGAYDQGGFISERCFLTKKGKAVVCQVSASKGEGAATDTFRVVMNLRCSKAFRIELIGEE